ncbi:MAG: DUF4126 domain-containing protein [bacterium]|nr:DUF4126 domain-containing protein [bacterium]
MDAATQYALAYSLTTAAGVRAVLALAVVSVAAHIGLLHPPAFFAWLASPVAMWILIVVALLELLADKVPVLDHALHVLQIVVKPAAAAIVVGGTVHPQSNEMLVFLMVVGALNALGVHAGIATARGASTLATAGLGNPVVSTVEDAGALGTSLLAFVAPFVVAVAALLFTIAMLVLARRTYVSVRARSTSS